VASPVQPARPSRHQTIELKGKIVKLQIWDTAGQERFRTITQAYYRGAMGILLIYDVTNTKSWSNVRNWVRNIESNAPQTVNRMLIGNKCDMTSSRQVTTAQGETLAREYGMRFLETSSRDNINVGDAFLALATDVVDRIGTSGDATGAGGFAVNAPAAAEKKGCC
jgi:Ras-related protein Rab-8A